MFGHICVSFVKVDKRFLSYFLFLKATCKNLQFFRQFITTLLHPTLCIFCLGQIKGSASTGYSQTRINLYKTLRRRFRLVLHTQQLRISVLMGNNQNFTKWRQLCLYANSWGKVTKFKFNSVNIKRTGTVVKPGTQTLFLYTAYQFITKVKLWFGKF